MPVRSNSLKLSHHSITLSSCLQLCRLRRVTPDPRLQAQWPRSILLRDKHTADRPPDLSPPVCHQKSAQTLD